MFVVVIISVNGAPEICGEEVFQYLSDRFKNNLIVVSRRVKGWKMFDRSFNLIEIETDCQHFDSKALDDFYNFFEKKYPGVKVVLTIFKKIFNLSLN